jgi:hypothetical protein
MNEIKYCVNYKGQKIKPYKSVYVSPKKQIDWNKIVSYACLIAVSIVLAIPALLAVLLFFN